MRSALELSNCTARAEPKDSCYFRERTKTQRSFANNAARKGRPIGGAGARTRRVRGCGDPEIAAPKVASDHRPSGDGYPSQGPETSLCFQVSALVCRARGGAGYTFDKNHAKYPFPSLEPNLAVARASMVLPRP